MEQWEGGSSLVSGGVDIDGWCFARTSERPHSLGRLPRIRTRGGSGAVACIGVSGHLDQTKGYEAPMELQYTAIERRCSVVRRRSK